jgi:hypothetical protein
MSSERRNSMAEPVHTVLPTQPATATAAAVPEPPDGAVVLVGHPLDGTPEDAWLRNDRAAQTGGYGDKHWFPLGRYDVEYPETWDHLIEEQFYASRLFVVTATAEIGNATQDTRPV